MDDGLVCEMNQLTGKSADNEERKKGTGQPNSASMKLFLCSNETQKEDIGSKQRLGKISSLQLNAVA